MQRVMRLCGDGKEYTGLGQARSPPRNGRPLRHTKALAEPDDHHFIEISRHGQGQEISMLQYDYHTKITLGGPMQLESLQLGLVESQTVSGLISRSLSTTQTLTFDI
jgi:hypothetical protein